MLYLHDGTPAAGLRVEVRESALVGQPTAERMQVYYTDASGNLDIPAIQGSDIRVFAQARGFDVTCDGVWLAVPEQELADIGTLVPPDGFDPPTEVIVAIPTGGGGFPQGNDNDLQMKAGTNFVASLARQDLNISGAVALGSDGDKSVKGFLTHNTVTIKSPLTQNVTGAALATGLRVMDTDDGAGNAQWFEMLGSYGAFNFQWQHTGTGAPSREFFIDNGRTRIVMHGFWRGNVDEGDQIALFTLDPSPHDSTNYQFLNGLVVSGEWHPMDTFGPGVYIKAHNNDSGYGYAYGYQFYFDHDGLNLPKDPVLPTHAATKSYVDAHAGASPSGNDFDIQMKQGSALAAAKIYQGIGSSSTLMQSEGDPRVPFPSHNYLATKTALTANVSGSAFATGLRIYDTDDGAGNSQFFEILPSYGALNFLWGATGTGQPSREFLIQNGRSQITISGQYRGGFNEGDFIQAYTVDGGNYMNGFRLQGEDPGSSGHPPGVYIQVHTASYPGQFYFDQFGLNLPADPTNALHAATKQYVDAHAGGGAPAGSGSEIQYRASASAFGAITNSSVSSGLLSLPSKLNIVAIAGQATPTEIHIQAGDPNNSCALMVDGIAGSGLQPFVVFNALHQAGAQGVIYFGRNNWITTQGAAMQMSFWTSSDGTNSSRRFHIGPTGAVFVNPGATTAAGDAMTVYDTGFTNALYVSGKLALWDGAAKVQVLIGPAGSGPGGSGRALYLS